jgi:hypothetical protein
VGDASFVPGPIYLQKQLGLPNSASRVIIDALVVVLTVATIGAGRAANGVSTIAELG